MLDNRVLNGLKKALDGSTIKHNAIAHNIANINTPGYKKLEVSFQEQLKTALDRHKGVPLIKSHPQHIHQQTLSQVEPKISKDKSTSIRLDGNNVDLDQEMAKMAVNSLYYNSAVSQINKRIALIKHVISEGRR